jgi:ligand-binding SRPBCC domain-containing protein
MPRIQLTTDIDASPEVCFDAARDVGVHLASSRSERVVGGVREGMLKLDDEVTWSAWHFGIPWRMTSKIVEYQRPGGFVDEMQRGPFGRWRHRHVFQTNGKGTRMVDDVNYASPFGLLGLVVDRLLLERYMTRLLRRHNQHVRAVAEEAAPRTTRGGR